MNSLVVENQLPWKVEEMERWTLHSTMVNIKFVMCQGLSAEDGCSMGLIRKCGSLFLPVKVEFTCLIILCVAYSHQTSLQVVLYEDSSHITSSSWVSNFISEKRKKRNQGQRKIFAKSQKWKWRMLYICVLCGKCDSWSHI